MKRAALILTALLCGCASAPRDDWSRTDTRRELFYVAALAADTYTTAQFADDPMRVEGLGVARSIYGSDPDARSVLLTSIVGGIAHWLIARRLNERPRRAWQYGFTAGHATAALYNCANGNTGC